MFRAAAARKQQDEHKIVPDTIGHASDRDDMCFYLIEVAGRCPARQDRLPFVEQQRVNAGMAFRAVHPGCAHCARISRLAFAWSRQTVTGPGGSENAFT